MWFLFTTTRAQYSIRDTEATYFIYQFNAIECPLPCMPKMCSPDIFIVEKLQLNLCGETVNWMASKWGRHTFIYTDSVPLYVLLTLFMRISVFLVRVRELPHNQWLFYHIFFLHTHRKLTKSHPFKVKCLYSQLIMCINFFSIP